MIRFDDLTLLAQNIALSENERVFDDMEIVIKVDEQNLEVLNEELFIITNPGKRFSSLTKADEIRAIVSDVKFKIVLKEKTT